MANYTLNTDERSLSLYCRSEDASFLGDATYRWEFPNTIGQTKERNKRLVIGVKSICFTNGIYNINATTNTVNWDGTNYTIPEELYGNYTSANIIQLLGGQPIVGLFNPTTGVTNPSWTGNPPNVLTVFSTTKSKFFIKKNAANTTFNITPFWALLGFTKDVFALTTYAEADEVSDLKSFTSLIVKTNLGVTAYTTKMGMENVTPATSWDDWCYWNAVITRPRYVSINEMVRTGINPDYYNSDPAWHSTSSENWQLLESSDETWVSSAKDEYDMIQIAEEYFMNLEN